MLSRRALLGGGLASAVSAAGTPRRAPAQQVVIDSAGRSVTLPARIDRVFAAGPPAAIFVYALTPDRLLGWRRDLRVEEQAYLPARYAGLPALGRLTGRGGTANVETALGSPPDVITADRLGAVYGVEVTVVPVNAGRDGARTVCVPSLGGTAVRHRDP
jgi:iron complex transport system substrate-binding protein